MFHKACIDEWLCIKRECPTCKMPLLDNTVIQKIVTMCTLNYFCNCLNSSQFEHARSTIRSVIDHFIVDDIITIDTEKYCNKTRVKTIDMINELRIDLSRLLQVKNDDTLMDHPLINQYNEFIYDYQPFNEVVEQYPTTSIISTTFSWITEMMNQ